MLVESLKLVNLVADTSIGLKPAVFSTFDLEMCFAPHKGVHFFDNWTTCGDPQVARTCGNLYILASTCASRHKGVHFFNISISKSGPRPTCFATFYFQMCFPPRVRFFYSLASESAPNLRCFVHFDLQVCFAPHRCAIFHLLSGQLASHPPL